MHFEWQLLAPRSPSIRATKPVIKFHRTHRSCRLRRLTMVSKLSSE